MPADRAPRFDLTALEHWLAPFGLQLDREQLGQTAIFLDTLLLWNRRTNLVSQTRRDDIVIKHLADSFVTASLLQPNERVADLGSGAGFPGIPIAIARPRSSVFLVEGNQKRVSFLSEAAARCRLSNVIVVDERIETFSRRPGMAHSLTAITARALWKVPDLIAAATVLLAPGGRLLAMKGPGYAEELPVLHGTRFSLTNVIDYELPDRSARHIVELCFT